MGGLLSVALSLGSPPVPVKDHPALWSPDFPPSAFDKQKQTAIVWLSPTTYILLFSPVPSHKANGYSADKSEYP